MVVIYTYTHRYLCSQVRNPSPHLFLIHLKRLQINYFKSQSISFSKKKRQRWGLNLGPSKHNQITKQMLWPLCYDSLLLGSGMKGNPGCLWVGAWVSAWIHRWVYAGMLYYLDVWVWGGDWWAWTWSLGESWCGADEVIFLFLYCWIGNLGTLFCTALTCKNCCKIGPAHLQLKILWTFHFLIYTTSFSEINIIFMLTL